MHYNYIIKKFLKLINKNKYYLIILGNLVILFILCIIILIYGIVDFIVNLHES